LIVDKTCSLKVIHWMLTNWGASGKNQWHYFTPAELEHLVPNDSFEASFAAYGVLSFGEFGGGILQKTADLLDRYLLEQLVPQGKRAVFSLMIARRK
jgi:hypothetical protein